MPQRDLVYGPEAMDDVGGEYQGYPEAGFRHSLLLYGIAQYRIVLDIDEAPDSRRNRFIYFTDVVGIVRHAYGILVELHDLFFQGHPAEQVVYPLFDGGRSVLIDGLTAGARSGKEREG